MALPVHRFHHTTSNLHRQKERIQQHHIIQPCASRYHLTSIQPPNLPMTKQTPTKYSSVPQDDENLTRQSAQDPFSDKKRLSSTNRLSILGEGLLPTTKRNVDSLLLQNILDLIWIALFIVGVMAINPQCTGTYRVLSTVIFWILVSAFIARMYVWSVRYRNAGPGLTAVAVWFFVLLNTVLAGLLVANIVTILSVQMVPTCTGLYDMVLLYTFFLAMQVGCCVMEPMYRKSHSWIFEEELLQ